jgi:hypothetical protein
MANPSASSENRVKAGLMLGSGARINLLAANCFVYLLLTKCAARRFPERPTGGPRAG